MATDTLPEKTAKRKGNKAKKKAKKTRKSKTLLPFDPRQDWPAWQRHLEKRKPRKGLDVYAKDSASLRWGMADGMAEHLSAWQSEVGRAMRAAGSSAEDLCDAWQSELIESISASLKDQPSLGARFAVEPSAEEGHVVVRSLQAIHLAALLPSLSSKLESEPWWELADTLLELTEQALVADSDADEASGRILVDQLLAGELALTLSTALPELPELESLGKQACRCVSEGFDELLDGEGLPHANHLGISRLLLASWTRVILQLRGSTKQHKSKGRVLSEDAMTEYSWVVLQSILLSRGDGSLAFSPHASWSQMRPLVQQALEISGDPSDVTAAQQRCPKITVPEKLRRRKAAEPEANNHSEWAGISVLADDWKTSRVTTAYDDGHHLIEVVGLGGLLLSGAWDCSVTIDGKQLPSYEDWTVQCWFSDEDCDFLELSTELGSMWRLERQIVLAKDEQCLLLSDVVTSANGAEMEPSQHDIVYRGVLPIASALTFHGESETRDALLGPGKSKKKAIASVMPLALPEWRVEKQVGELTAEDGSLVISQRQQGSGIMVPLWFDLDPQRARRARTWRHLTVAESLEIVRPDRAVGFRIQSDDEQWLVYRSLSPRANRTVLGQNLSSEFFVGKIDTDGDVDQYVETETEAD